MMPFSLRARFAALLLAAAVLPGCGSSENAADRPPAAGGDAVGAASLVRQLDFSPFDDALDALEPGRLATLERITLEADIAGLRRRLQDGEMTVRELALLYLSRIRRFDADLRSVIELDPDALAEADRLDERRTRGQEIGALHGIPILLKDNVATEGRLHNSAGAAALAEHVAPRDAFVAARLREAGALILGKTNMSEWAYFMSSEAPSGYSALGGQAVNPFGEELAVLGSSTGSAIAVAARFAAAAIGTETTGSIVAPAAANGVGGMRPTFGLVSGDLIIPISAALDGAGPLSRHVADLALLLNVIGTRDDADPNVAFAADVHGTDFTAELPTSTLSGLRVGVPTFALPERDTPEAAVLDRVVGVLEENGASVIPVTFPAANLQTLAAEQLDLLTAGMRDDVAAYLAAAEAPLDSLADVIAFNEADPERRAPFGQDLLIAARDSTTTAEERAALAARLRTAALEGIARAVSEADGDVDVLMSLDNTFSLVYALGGTPAVTVPAGRDAEGQPRGATFVGLAPGSDAAVLGTARAFERAASLREEPPLGAP